jgi:uncharacterized protein (TIGR02646 family)
MRNIQKQAEPASLTEHRCNQYTDYDNYQKKDDLRESLVSEQRGICCYCMQRLPKVIVNGQQVPDASRMKIEHWQCQDRFPQLQLQYTNLLGACLGGEGKRPKEQHCDTKKANLDLTYCPSNPAHDVELRLKFLGDGRISSDDASMADEIERVLNLNEAKLVRNRKGVLDAFKERLGKKQATNAALRRDLAEWNGDNGGDLAPFCQVVVYYLRKKLGTA